MLPKDFPKVLSREAAGKKKKKKELVYALSQPDRRVNSNSAHIISMCL